MPEADPFNCELLLYNLGDKAFRGIRHGHLFQQSSTVVEHSRKMKTYLLAYKYVNEYDANQVQLTEEGRELRSIGDIAEYRRINYWKRNWKMIVALITLGISFATLIMRCVWHHA